MPKLLPSPLRSQMVSYLPGIILVICLGTAALLWQLHSAQEALYEHTAALQTIRSEISLAHEQLSFAISHNLQARSNYAQHNIEKAIGLGNALLLGNIPEAGFIAPLQETAPRQKLQTLLTICAEYTSATTQHWSTTGSMYSETQQTLAQKRTTLFSQIKTTTQEIHQLLTQQIASNKEKAKLLLTVFAVALLALCVSAYGNFKVLCGWLTTTQRQLAESEAQLQTIFRAVPVSVGMVQNRTLLHANEALTRMTGFSPEETIGKSTREFYADDASFHKAGELLYANGEDMVEVQMRRKNGSIFSAIVQLSPVHFGTEEKVYSFAVMDITERKLAEKEREHLNALLQEIINAMPSLLVGVTQDNIVTLWNRTAENHLGITHNEAIGQSLHTVFPWLSRTVLHPHSTEGSTHYLHKIPWETEGKMRSVDVTIFPIVYGNIQGSVVRVDDVTEKVLLEETLIQTEKMMSVGGLAAGVAHEINNPLGIILQSSQNTLRRFSPSLPANQEEAKACGIDLQAVNEYMARRKIYDYLGAIREAGARAADIVSNMLNFSRKSESKLAPGNINEMLETVIDLASSDYDLTHRYDFKQVRIEKNYSTTLPLIPCTRTEIEQVFLNIIKNAAQAVCGKKDGYIRITTEQKDDKICIQIADNGPGMDEHTRKRVFEPFFTTKSTSCGTGLGLSVSYFIITSNHQGNMQVNSRAGEGTTFTISLPTTHH